MKIGELDRETSPTENFTVIAQDNGIPERQSNVTVVIVVADFNDNAPEFGSFIRTVHLPENSKTGTTVLTINATDKDEGPNKEITFSVVNFQDKFEINGSTV